MHVKLPDRLPVGSGEQTEAQLAAWYLALRHSRCRERAPASGTAPHVCVSEHLPADLVVDLLREHLVPLRQG
jgi:hypothetical protein